MRIIPFLSCCLAVAVTGSGAEGPTQAAGHWEGAIRIPAPSMEIRIVVDLDRNHGGIWVGSIDTPAQGIKAFPLSDVTVNGDAVGFRMNGLPGNPTFRGRLTEGGATLSGEYTQGIGTGSFALRRTGEAKVKEIAESTAITKALTGRWEGTLEPPGGPRLRLVLVLAAGSDGKGTGTLTSVDQNSVKLPIGVVVQKGSGVRLELQAPSASYSGELSNDGMELTGEWSQGGGSLPLAFKKSATKEKVGGK